MDKTKLESLKKSELRSKSITVRTFPSYSKFLGKYEVSPSKLFNKAVEDLMKEQGE